MIEITPETIETIVLQSTRPVAVFFTSPNCGPCRFVYPILQSLVAEYEDRLTIVKADVDVVDDWRRQLQIMSIPRICIFSQGKLVKCLDVRKKGDLRLEFDALLAPSSPPSDSTAIEVYLAAVSAAKANMAKDEEELGAWWAAIIGQSAAASDAAWAPINEATDQALANDQAYLAKSEEGRRWAWVYKREEIKGEARFADVLIQIAAADADFDEACKPHAQERGQRYKDIESAYDTAVQAARQAYMDRTGIWPPCFPPAA